MRAVAINVAGAAILLSTLTGCGQSEYCKAVDANKVAINSLGEKKSNDAFLSYARAFRTVAKVAPASVRKDWTKMADVTQAVVTAQVQAGVSLEQTSGETLAKVPLEKREKLNAAYEAFNDTANERKAVVKNVKDECEITLT